jgi:hypothetical protein
VWNVLPFRHEGKPSQPFSRMENAFLIAFAALLLEGMSALSFTNN